MSRVHLVVLYGGQSAEHDVSCVTAAHVLAAIDPARYRVTPIGISTSGDWALGEAAQAALAAGPEALPSRLDTAGPLVSVTDVIAATSSIPDADEEITVVLPLLHGPMGEDGTVQGLLELADAAYVGAGVLGSALAMDKAMAKQVLGANGIPQATYRALREPEITPGLPAQLTTELGLPCFVKPSNMGSSVGVTKAHTVEELRDAIDVALTYDEWVVVEEAVTAREIEVAVLGNHHPEASVPGEVVPSNEFYDYHAKYLDGRSECLIPAAIAPEQAARCRALAVQAFLALECAGLARVDFFLDRQSGEVLVNEINTLPGFTPISMYPKLWAASGLTYSALIDRLIQLAVERWRERNAGARDAGPV